MFQRIAWGIGLRTMQKRMASEVMRKMLKSQIAERIKEGGELCRDLIERVPVEWVQEPGEEEVCAAPGGGAQDGLAGVGVSGEAVV